MNFYQTETINKAITAIRSMTGEILYLIQGDKEAVLIDAGPGVGQLRKAAEKLTNKPLKVLLSHGHVDHVSGAAEFQSPRSTVYLNKNDLELYRRHCRLQERKGYLQANMGEQFTMLTEEDFVKEDPDKRFLDLKEGMVFALGGIHIEVYELPGHTRGSSVFLIPEFEILILGDACNNATFLFDQDAGTVEEYLLELKRIREKLEGRFKIAFQSHHVAETDSDIISNMIQICEDIIAGNADDQPYTFMGMQAYIAKACNERFERNDGKSGNLIYSKGKIRSDDVNNK